LVAVESPAQLVPGSEVIFIGEVTRADSEALVLRPEAFLKGPVSSEPVTLPVPGGGVHATAVVQGAECPRVDVAEGQRLLVYVSDADDPHYPYVNEAYVLQDGHARMDGSPELTEVEVVAQIRAITGQYAVPAASEGEGAGIDWGNTVLPLGIALGIVFVIGLLLMRVWHRIDPS
jgi:hypothetical protein